MHTLVRSHVVIRSLLVLVALAAILAAARPTFAASDVTPGSAPRPAYPADMAPGGIDGPNPPQLDICQDRGVTFTATASGSPAPSAQWQVSADNGVTFTNIPGATSTTLTFTARLTDNNKQYRAVFTNRAGTATSGAATLIVHTAAAVTTNPTNQAVTVGGTATFSAAGTGYQAVQWQVSTNNGVSFNDIPGATSTTLSFTVQFGDSGKQYRAVFMSDFGCRTPTGAATLSVGVAPQGIDGPNPPLEELCENRGGTFTATASGSPAPSAQWQVSADNGATFTDIPGATSTTFTFTAHASDNGKLYRTVFTNAYGTATSGAALLIIHLNPTVTMNPTNQAAWVGRQVTFTAAASGNPAVQWQVSVNNGASFSDIPGATSATLSFTAQQGDGGKQYRAVFTSTFGCGTSVTSAATLAPVAPGVLGDISGDSKSDLLWRNTASGQSNAWFMNGGSVRSYNALPNLPSLDWQPVGLGDLNGDGKTDLLWRNTATSDIKARLMNGATVLSDTALPSVADQNWQLIAANDLNADGKADLVWRNTSSGQNVAWLMNGASVASYAWLPTVSDPTWQLVATGDLNADGKADLVWRNTSTGQNIAWLMGGGSVASYAWLPTVSDGNWRIVGMGDLNADGRADLLWRNTSTGENVAWLMDGGSVTSYIELPTVPGQNWKLVAAEDLNGDGKADLTWRNFSTGENVAWLMDGGSVTSYAWLPTVTDMGWRVISPTSLLGALNGVLPAAKAVATLDQVGASAASMSVAPDVAKRSTMATNAAQGTPPMWSAPPKDMPPMWSAAPKDAQPFWSDTPTVTPR